MYYYRIKYISKKLVMNMTLSHFNGITSITESTILTDNRRLFRNIIKNSSESIV